MDSITSATPENKYEDQIFTCTCEKQFIHSAGEQKWMRERFGEKYAPPRLCQECRKTRKQTQNTQDGE